MTGLFQNLYYYIITNLHYFYIDFMLLIYIYHCFLQNLLFSPNTLQKMIHLCHVPLKKKISFFKIDTSFLGYAVQGIE